LADKIDTLVGFWAIGEKPTGSKDPYALRRAALGVIRLFVDNQLRVSLVPIFVKCFDSLKTQIDTMIEAYDLLRFITDRLKVQLRDQGARHDLVDAVLGAGQLVSAGESFLRHTNDVLFLIVCRVEALAKFLDTDDGKNLLAGYKRAVNIIRIEEKK